MGGLERGSNYCTSSPNVWVAKGTSPLTTPMALYLWYSDVIC